MRKYYVVAGLLSGAPLGCGEGVEAGGAFTEQEQAALITALRFDGTDAADWALRTIVRHASEIGPMEQYSVLASQVLLTFQDQTSATFSSYGFSRLDGWTELNAGAGAVSSAIAVHANFLTASFPSSIRATVDPTQGVYDEMRANYRSGASEYVAISGEINLSASGFGSFENCAYPPEDLTNFEVVSCRYSFGMVDGSFRFEADRLQGSGPGPELFSQPSTSFELPALRLEIQLQLNGGPKPVTPSALPALTDRAMALIP